MTLVGVACGGSDDGATGDTGGDDVAVVDDGADTATDAGGESSGVPDVLAFTAPLVGGGELDAAALADKPTAFWFWAPT